MKKEFYNIANLVTKNAKILDVGCGNGELMKYITENISKDIRGIELSKSNVQKCVEKGLTVIEGDAEKDLRQFPDNSFDFVILSQTLQAFLDPENVLNELLRVGKKAIHCTVEPMEFWVSTVKKYSPKRVYTHIKTYGNCNNYTILNEDLYMEWFINNLEVNHEKF